VLARHAPKLVVFARARALVGADVVRVYAHLVYLSRCDSAATRPGRGALSAIRAGVGVDDSDNAIDARARIGAGLELDGKLLQCRAMAAIKVEATLRLAGPWRACGAWQLFAVHRLVLAASPVFVVVFL
jgi:hypothetical protein